MPRSATEKELLFTQGIDDDGKAAQDDAGEGKEKAAEADAPASCGIGDADGNWKQTQQLLP